MTRRVQDRATFRALAGGLRRGRGPLTVVLAADARPGMPRVAFAIGRSVGTAVDRNRLRRRLRATVRERAGELGEGGAYLVSAGPAARDLSYRELHALLGGVLAELREGSA